MGFLKRMLPSNLYFLLVPSWILLLDVLKIPEFLVILLTLIVLGSRLIYLWHQPETPEYGSEIIMLIVINLLAIASLMIELFEAIIPNWSIY